jgi:hypothetical protein
MSQDEPAADSASVVVWMVRVTAMAVAVVLVQNPMVEWEKAARPDCEVGGETPC